MSDSGEKTKGEGKKKGKLPIMAIIGIIVVLNVVVVGKVMMSKKAAPAHKEEPEIGVKMALAEFLVNLAGPEQYLKATLALGMKKGLTEEKLKEEIPPIRDTIISVVSTKKAQDLMKDPSRDKLKAELKESLNKALSENKEMGKESVLKVYITDFAIQQ